MRRLSSRYSDFTDFEAQPDRVQRNNGRQGQRRRGGHQAAHLHQAVANASADGRANGGVFQIEFGGPQSRLVGVKLRLRRVDLRLRRQARLLDVGFLGVDVGLIGLERRVCVIQILLRRGVFFHQGPEPVDVLFRFEQVGLGLREIGFGLRQRHLAAGEFQVCFGLRDLRFGARNLRLVGSQVEHVKFLPGGHVGADEERSFLDVAVHTSAHLDGIAGEGLRGVFAENGNVLRLDLDHRDAGGRSRCRRASSLGRSGLTTNQKERESNRSSRKKIRTGMGSHAGFSFIIARAWRLDANRGTEQIARRTHSELSF